MPNVHGAPVHMGDPKEVGVDDVMKPDYGEAVDIYEKYWNKLKNQLIKY